MTFKEALKKLGIEDYAERIFRSNSHGELTHLADYIWMAEKYEGDPEVFRFVFEIAVGFAKENWQRPESCFQHMPKLISDIGLGLERFFDSMKSKRKKKK